MIRIFAFSDEALALALPSPKHVWYDSNRIVVLDGPDLEVLPPGVPQVVDAMQGLLAIEAAGLAPAYKAWAGDPARTFKELAFIDRAAVWRRNDPVLIAGAGALGLSGAQIDGLFVIAAGIQG